MLNKSCHGALLCRPKVSIGTFGSSQDFSCEIPDSLMCVLITHHPLSLLLYLDVTGI